MAERSIEALSTKRATRACLSCRLKKIRCDVEEKGQPCSNCLFDEVLCEVTSSKRGRKPGRRLKLPPKQPKPKRGSIQDAAPVDPTVDGPGPVVPLCRVSPTHTTGWLDGGVELEMLSQRCDEGTVPKRSAAEVDHRYLHQELTFASLIAQEALHNVATVDLTRSGLTSPPPTSPSAGSPATNHDCLPGFVKSLSHIITRQDIDYLRLKGALEIPSPGFLKALFRAYVQYVYPYMPSIDIATIRRTMAGETASISILLLQAIAFAGVPFVDMDEIRRAGFDSRRSCRKTFYDKAKLLYDLDVESDKLTVIQATLLIAYWNETPGDNKGAWHWMGVAISLAQMLGMHRKAEYKDQSHEHKLYKRVWWSCYIRDRLLGIAMCRPLRIKDAEFNTPLLTLEDFDIFDLCSATGGPFLDTESHTALAEMCIRTTELCQLVAGVLDLHFSIFPSEDSPTARDNGKDSAMLYLKHSPPDEQLVQKYDEQLQAWYRTLPPSCVYGAMAGQRSSSPCVVVNGASLHITFWAVVSALHRPYLRNGDQAVSAQRVEEAAVAVSRIDREMHQLSLDQYLPATAGIPFQFPVFITHTRRLEHRDATEVLDSLFFCIKVIETQRELFVGGDAGLKFIAMAARQAHLTPRFDRESKLCRIDYRGFHYSPENPPLDFDPKDPTAAFDDFSPRRILCESALETDPPTTGQAVDLSDSEPPSFDHINAIDWDGLSDFLPVFDTSFDQCFGRLVNLDYL